MRAAGGRGARVAIVAPCMLLEVYIRVTSYIPKFCQQFPNTGSFLLSKQRNLRKSKYCFAYLFHRA